MRSYSLDCLTLPDVGPIDLVGVAADTGYGSFSLWVQQPAVYEVMLATPAMARELAAAMSDHGIELGNLEVFNLNTDEPIDAHEPALAFGAELGASTATAIDFGVPRPDIAERFAAFCALAARHGLAALVEPISMGNVRTPDDGLALIEAAGVEARLVIDCVHLVRTGGTAAALRELPSSTIGYLQLCDGPASIGPDDIGVEAMANRLYPGEGEFPLGEILAVVPPDVTIGLEVPNLARQQRGDAATDRARAAIAAARVVEQAEGSTP